MDKIAVGGGLPAGVVDLDAKPDPMATGNVLVSNAELFEDLQKRLRGLAAP